MHPIVWIHNIFKELTWFRKTFSEQLYLFFRESGPEVRNKMREFTMSRWKGKMIKANRYGLQK